MFGHFYNGKIEKVLGGFATLFSRIEIKNNPKDLEEIPKTIPISYFPRSKFIESYTKIRNKIEDQKIAVSLPAMSFEIVGFVQLTDENQQKDNIVYPSGDSSIGEAFTPSVYIINMTLHFYAKTMVEVYQFLEQVWPRFKPQYNINIRNFKDYPDNVEPVPVRLTATSIAADIEGPNSQRPSFIAQLDFEIKSKFYGPVVDASLIETIEAKIFSDVDPETEFPNPVAFVNVSKDDV